MEQQREELLETKSSNPYISFCYILFLKIVSFPLTSNLKNSTMSIHFEKAQVRKKLCSWLFRKQPADARLYHKQSKLPFELKD